MPVNMGFDNFVMSHLVSGFVKADSAHIKKIRQDATEKGLLINATSGHKTRSVIILISGQVFLSPLQTTTFKRRIEKAKSKHQEQNDVDDQTP